jgi:hypothetical protein
MRWTFTLLSAKSRRDNAGDESAGTRAIEGRRRRDVMTFGKKVAGRSSICIVTRRALLGEENKENRLGPGMSGIPLDRNVGHNLVSLRLSTFFLQLAGRYMIQRNLS